MAVLKSGQARYKESGKIINTSSQDNIRKLSGKILSGRVVEIDQTGTSTNGYAQIQILDEIKLGGSDILPDVLPFFPNLKNYPLINETVLIISLANKDYASNMNTATFYYLSPLNIWNNQQVNPIPYSTENIQSNTQNRGYLNVAEVGIPNKPSVGPNTILNPGYYFDEKSYLNPTYPYEGDYLIDGRFGNSIRIGNTVPQGNSPVPNNWSTAGRLGDPITIINNDKHRSVPSYNSITEDINLDGASAYFTSTQKIPLQPSTTEGYTAYTSGNAPTKINQYTENQVILNAGRLVFNAKEDHIILSGQKSVSLNANQSVTLDSKKIVINAQSPLAEGGGIFLGDKSATEPVLKGDTTVYLLELLCDSLIQLCLALQYQSNNDPEAPVPLYATNTAAASSLSTISGIKDRLFSTKSTYTNTL